MTAGPKTLTMLRHAKSGWENPTLRDYERALNAKGRRAAELVGHYIRRENLAFDHVIASPATRVAETLAQVETSLGRSFAPVWDRRIYLASAVTLLDVVREAPAGAERVLLAGHNPGLEDLAMLLVPHSADPLRCALEEKYPTATLAELGFTGAWADLAAGMASLKRFVRPCDLDAALGPEED